MSPDPPLVMPSNAFPQNHPSLYATPDWSTWDARFFSSDYVCVCPHWFLGNVKRTVLQAGCA